MGGYVILVTAYAPLARLVFVLVFVALPFFFQVTVFQSLESWRRGSESTVKASSSP